MGLAGIGRAEHGRHAAAAGAVALRFRLIRQWRGAISTAVFSAATCLAGFQIRHRQDGAWIEERPANKHGLESLTPPLPVLFTVLYGVAPR